MCGGVLVCKGGGRQGVSSDIVSNTVCASPWTLITVVVPKHSKELCPCYCHSYDAADSTQHNKLARQDDGWRLYRHGGQKTLKTV